MKKTEATKDIKRKIYKLLYPLKKMSNNKIFPDLKKVLRNCIAVGIIAGVANFKNTYPPTLEMGWTIFAGFVIAFVIEFAHAYKLMPKPNGHRQDMATFFLA